MADRKLSALVALTAPTIDDELYIINAGVPQKIRMDDMSVDGTFTPTLYGSITAGTQTYSVQIGYYSRIGNLVHYELQILLTAFDALTAGELRVGGLPFLSVSNVAASIAFDANITMPASTILRGLISGGTQYIGLMSKTVGSTGHANLSATALLATSSIMVSGSYRTS